VPTLAASWHGVFEGFEIFSAKEVFMDLPFTFDLISPIMIPSRYDNHIIRRLTSLQGQFADAAAYAGALAKEDALVYEVHEIKRPEVAGELLHGISIVHPGKVAQEYYMTKGHFHVVLETAEVYYCLKGAGRMVMETPEGESSVAELVPGRVLYVPPRWAHRSVNVGKGDLVTLFIYPGHSGHDYGTIETKGFRKLIVEQDGRPVVVDNPRWLS
jgi:glucose-6-phosphate isomerase